MQLFIFSIAVCLGGAVAVPAPESHVLHEKRSSFDSKWEKRHRLHEHTVLPMRIGLRQSNLHIAEDLLMDVSHPDSPNYGKHYTSDEVVELFAPSDDTVSTVTDWLVKAGIAKNRLFHSNGKSWLSFDATAAEAESLLYTEFHVYEHGDSGKGTIACDSYHLPKDVQEHVDFVTPGIKLVKTRNVFKREVSKHGLNIGGHIGKSHRRILPEILELGLNGTPATQLKNCDQVIAPICLATLYQIPPGKLANKDNKMGIFETEGGVSGEDLDSYFWNYAPQIPNGTLPEVASIDGGVAILPLDESDGEPALDFQLAYPIVWPQGVVVYQADDTPYATQEVTDNNNGSFNTFLDALDGSYCNYSAFGETGDLPGYDPVYPDTSNFTGAYNESRQCGVYKPTNVISVSYAGVEAFLPDFYQKRQCNEFLKLGLQGTTVLFSSGDTGVASDHDQDDPASGNGCLGAGDGGNGTIFAPLWPVSCPWLTTVGATKIYPGHTAYEVESSVVDASNTSYDNGFFSGGGFSNLFTIPSYQADAVATYFAKHNPPYKYYEGGENMGKDGGVYNRAGRGYPDVAANGDNIAVVVRGEWYLSGGTSASAPIFGAIINRINEERLAAGKTSVGFINPTLYANPRALNDITNGSNPGCFTTGFNATKGWDPVSGLGTPSYPRMLDLFMSLP